MQANHVQLLRRKVEDQLSIALFVGFKSAWAPLTWKFQLSAVYSFLSFYPSSFCQEDQCLKIKNQKP